MKGERLRRPALLRYAYGTVALVLIEKRILLSVKANMDESWDSRSEC